MQDNNKKLNEFEEKELREAHDVYEMSQSAGFKILKEKLNELAYHSWVDPRGANEKDWMWQELNAFHSASVAKEILDWIDTTIARGTYLGKKQKGEISTGPMKI